MKILVVTLSNLGDVVLTLPVVLSLHRKYPQATIDVIVGASAKSVFENDTRIRRVTVYDKKMPWSGQWRFLAGVRRERYDVIVDLRYSLIGLLGGAKKRNSYLPSLSRRGHRAAKHLAALAGIAPAVRNESFLKPAGADAAPWMPNGRFVAAAVGSKSDLKKWPAEKYAQLLYRLASEHACSVVLIGDKSDMAAAAAVKAHLLSYAGGRALPLYDLSGRTDLSALVAVIGRASLVVTNDSAPLHIADSLGIPVLAVFGPSDPKKYGPRGATSLAVSTKLFCQPCERAQCRYGHECMKELPVSEVYAKAVEVLEGRPRTENFRVLVVRLDRIGDVVLSVPAIEALRRRFPQAHLSVMTRPETQALLAGHPAVDEGIAYDYEKGGRHTFPLGYFRFLHEISKRRFDAAIVLHPGVRSTLVPFLAGIPNRIGYRNEHAWLLTQALPDERRLGRKHESQYALDLVAALTGVREGSPVPPRLEPDPTVPVREGRWIAVHPGASCPSKRWPLERFRALVRELLNDFPEHSIAIIGGRETDETARLIAAGLGRRVLNLADRQDLRQLTSFLAHCDLLISNDSGPVHVAAAVGTRVVSLFGRNQAGLSPRRWRPLGHGHVVIQKDVGCLVCLAHECPIEFECLKAISVKEVLNEARNLLVEPVT